MNAEGVIGLGGQLFLLDQARCGSTRDTDAASRSRTGASGREHARARRRVNADSHQLKAFKVFRRVWIGLCRISTLAHSIHTIISLRISLAGV